MRATTALIATTTAAEDVADRALVREAGATGHVLVPVPVRARGTGGERTGPRLGRVTADARGPGPSRGTSQGTGRDRGPVVGDGGEALGLTTRSVRPKLSDADSEDQNGAGAPLQFVAFSVNHFVMLSDTKSWKNNINKNNTPIVILADIGIFLYIASITRKYT